ncbi:MAG: thiol peroxidase [Thermodesulfobacteriota bacterium]
MLERKGLVTLQGSPITLVGPEPKVGDKAPEFSCVGNDLAPVSLGDFTGKVLILSSVPSLDTPVCDMETRRFNMEAEKLGENVRIVTISTDLPFAQKRWCGAAGVSRVITASDHRDVSFGLAYGVLIKDLRLLARAIFVVDGGGVLRYRQLVPEIAQEPDYQAVLAAVRQLL